jgi:endonuclease/exonuclease/phosphatase family metal-dependent hydrolase
MGCAGSSAIIVKKVVFCIATFLLSATLSGAALLLNDSFSYPDGPLVTVSGGVWVHHSGSVSGQVAVVSGRVLLNEANAEDVNALLAGQPYPSSGTTNVFYASFTVKFTSLPGGGGTYFAHFKNSSTTFRARIWALTSGAALDRFRLGISSTDASAVGATNTMDLHLNTDYTVVTRLVNSNSVTVSTLWINPTAESDSSISITESMSAFTVVSYALRENTGEGALNLDNLRVGTSFADVFSNGSGQPPAITSQSPNQTITNGASVTFSVSASGTPPLSYQWQFTPTSDVGAQGTNLPGAVSSNLTLTGVTFAQAGFYAAVVTNAVGSTISDPVALSVWCTSAPAFSYLTYNAHGNGLTNWSTNMWHVQAIGRQMQYLNPDIITFNEIPVTNNCTAQMADFVTAFRPGYYLVTNSMDDGFIRSVILSRFPIVASTSWLHGSDLTPYGYGSSGFTRDLFEAQISVPGLTQPLHVFTAHLKSAQDADSSAKRAAEAGAVSNFFATVYLPANGQQPYVLSGDMNEDILRPPPSNPQSIQRLISAPTGLQLTTAVNPFTDSELTWSIQDTNNGPTVRYDYILPCAMLFSNIVSSQVFRTDLLYPVPPNLYSNDNIIASDHLPVFMVFGNPFNTPFRLLYLGRTNQIVSLQWESASNRSYNVEVSSNLTAWTPLATTLVATGANFTFTTNVPGNAKFFRVYRVP